MNPEQLKVGNIPLYEENSVTKYPLKGRCKKSPFMNGWHRVGQVFWFSPLEGAAGVATKCICLHCGKEFEKRNAFWLTGPRESQHKMLNQ